ncbi:MAG: Fe-S oxidoreductase, partial [Gaiellaceae bacterium]
MVAGLGAGRRVVFLHGLVARAVPDDRPADRPGRARAELEIVLGQKKLLQRLVPGLMHAFIFWGFLVLLPTILMAMISAVDGRAELPWLGRQE